MKFSIYFIEKENLLNCGKYYALTDRKVCDYFAISHFLSRVFAL